MRMRCTAFAQPEVSGPYLKPHSALDRNQYHRSWVDEDAYGDDDDGDDDEE